VHGELHQRGAWLAVHREQLGNNGGLGRVGRDAARIARPVQVRLRNTTSAASTSSATAGRQLEGG
jgi:hypothetical protein